MAEKNQKYDWGNTNAAAIFEAWKNGENYEKGLEDYLAVSLDFFRECLEGISKEAEIPDIPFTYDEGTMAEMQLAFHTFPSTMNITLTGEDISVTYLILISWDLDEEGAPGRYSVYAHRIHENGEVEIYFEENDTWETVDQKIIRQFAPDSRDEAVYGLFRALEGVGIVPPTYMSEEEVEKVISDNEKMLALYKAVKPLAVIIADDQVVSSLIEGIVPVNPYVQHLVVFQVADKLILGCISGVDENDPGTAKTVAVYATDSVDKMAEVLKVLWGPAEETAGDYPEVWAGDIISMEPEEAS